MNNLISIIVPIYCAEDYLNYCIDSILAQSYKNFELILVNDGSTDNSGKICDDYAKKDDRIKVIHKENAGVSSARNTGIENAKGEYILFIDSDDYVDSDYCSAFIAAKEEYPKVENIWCCINTVSNYNEKSNSKIEKNLYTVYYKNQFMTLHQKGLTSSPFNKLYCRNTILKNKLKMDTNLSLGEDLLFNIDYLSNTNKEIVVINKPLYNYVCNGKISLANKYYENMFDIYVRINNKLLNACNRFGCDNKEITACYNAGFYKFEVTLQNTFSKENKISFFKKIKYNNEIIKSNEFQSFFQNSQLTIHPILLKAYNHKSYFWIYLLKKLLKLLGK